MPPYLKKLVNTDDIWEVGVKSGNDSFRILDFFDGRYLIILNHAFKNKTKITPRQAIKLAEERKRVCFNRRKKMSELKKYIDKPKKGDPGFANGSDSGYEQFKVGVMLKIAREEAGLTQEQLADKLHTKKSAISRIENHAEDIKLSTLEKFAQALGKNLHLEVA